MQLLQQPNLWGIILLYNGFVKTAWFANDLITLTVTIPLLVKAMVNSQMTSTYWRLIWIGMLVYMFYNYAFYLFRSTFNRFFFIYAGLFSLSGYLLLYILLKTEMVEAFFNSHTPVKLISSYLFLMALILLMVELNMIAPFLISKKIP